MAHCGNGAKGSLGPVLGDQPARTVRKRPPAGGLRDSTGGAEGGLVLGHVTGSGAAGFQFEGLGIAVDDALQGAAGNAVGFEVGAALQGTGVADVAFDGLDQTARAQALDDVMGHATAAAQGSGGGGQHLEDLVFDRGEGTVAELALLQEVAARQQLTLAFEGVAGGEIQTTTTFQAALQRNEKFPIGDLRNLGDDCVHEALLASRK